MARTSDPIKSRSIAKKLPESMLPHGCRFIDAKQTSIDNSLIMTINMKGKTP